VRCDEVAELLLAPDADPADADAAAAHTADCARCAAIAARVRRLDAILGATLLEEPPLALQRQLLALVEAEWAPAHWWDVALAVVASDWVTRPHRALANAFAAICVVLAGWQVFAWLSSAVATIGDVPYALQLIASSPALAYLGDVQIDVPSLLAWSLVGALAWAVSERGPMHEWVFGPSRDAA
jgi:anti-sigma factor RsiW